MQTMISTLLKRQKRQTQTTRTVGQDEAKDFFLEEAFGRQGACYDPQLSFELDTNVTAFCPQYADQGDIDTLCTEQ